MPSFGASQSVSGLGGLYSGQHSKMRVAVDGVARLVPAGIGNRTGPIRAAPVFNSQAQQVRRLWLISGVTKDSAGAALGNCTVHLFNTADDTEVQETVSDGSGNYRFSVPGNSSRSYVVAYKSGSPDVAGTTVNTLLPVLL